MSGKDYLKFVTEQIVTYMDLSSEEKKLRKQTQKMNRPLYTSKWLGMLPFSLKIIFQKENSR